MSLLLYQIDAFTDVPFRGNPAAVTLLDRSLDEADFQHVAREMNLAETAFLHPRDDGSYDLRWFTPEVEVDLCGHATLASAHALWSHFGLSSDVPAVFHTKSGRLTCTRAGDGWIEMDFPAEPPEEIPVPDGLAEALGVPVRWCGANRMDLVVVLSRAEDVRALRPNLAALARFDVRGVVVTAPGDETADFVSRFFAPGAGVPEDPVTGSAHCALAPLWHARLGRTHLRGFQASARGGIVDVETRGERVLLRGQAVTVAEIRLLAL